MRKKLFLGLIFCCVNIFLFLPAFSENQPGQIIVRFRPGSIETPKGLRAAAAVSQFVVKKKSIRALNTKRRVTKYRQLFAKVLDIRPDWKHLENYYVIDFPTEEAPDDVAEEYKKDANVISASPNPVFHAFATTPNDPYFTGGYQYGLTNSKVNQAWDRTTGTSTTTVAVLDTGINYYHEDFSSKINLTDAWDFVNGDNDPWDDHSSCHGTTVSGVIAAATNNGKGIAGVDWQAKILPIKVLDANGSGAMTHILEGIEWAAAKNAQVINMSFGQYTSSTSLQDACTDAYNHGAVLVSAAGNGDVESPSYPAACTNVLGVAAVDQDDTRAVWTGIDPVTGRRQASNYGTWVDVCAPGTNIYSVSSNTSSYSSNNGTSIASPFVAGLAGLVRAANSSLTNQQIMDKIKETADNIDSINPSYAGKLGTGRINAYRAVAGVIAAITTPETGSYVTGALNIYGNASGWDFSLYTLEAQTAGGTLIATLETRTASVEGGLLGSWDTTSYNGAYKLKLKVLARTLGSQEAESSLYVDNTSPEAHISYPLGGATVGGAVTILGSAKDLYIDRYLLEYGAGLSPTHYMTIKTGYVSVEAGILGTWETTGLEGAYTLRLRVYDKVGFVSSEAISLTLYSTYPPTKEVDPQPGLPLTYALPNPFNRNVTGEVAFCYSLSGNFITRLYLLNMTGGLIWQQTYQAGENGGKAGTNNPSWNGRDLFGAEVVNGVYLYQVVADNRIMARGKMIILR